MFGQYPWHGVAGDPARDDLPARPRAVQRLRHVELVADDLRAAVDPVGEASRCVALPAACGVARAVSRRARQRSAAGAALGMGRVLLRRRPRRSSWAERLPGAAGALRARAVARAAAWMIERLRGLGRAVRDPARDVERGPRAQLPRPRRRTIRCCARRSRRSTVCCSRTTRRAADAAVPVAGLGHRARQPRARAGRPRPPAIARLARAASWLLEKQTRPPGRLGARATAAPPGGWYFEHRNELVPRRRRHLHGADGAAPGARRGPEAAQAAAIARGLAWMLGMQNRDGGWASFDRDNDKAVADPGAVRRSQRDDRSQHRRHHGPRARVPGLLPGLRRAPSGGRARAALPARATRAATGAWYGRWGVNYIYGTWQVLRGLACVGEDMTAPYVRRAVRLAARPPEPRRRLGREHRAATPIRRRRAGRVDAQPDRLGGDGPGRGGRGAQHRGPQRRAPPARTPGRRDGHLGARRRGPAPAFPKVFYLGYHLYRHTFPLMALAQYRRAAAGSEPR